MPIIKTASCSSRIPDRKPYIEYEGYLKKGEKDAWKTNKTWNIRIVPVNVAGDLNSAYLLFYYHHFM